MVKEGVFFESSSICTLMLSVSALRLITPLISSNAWDSLSFSQKFGISTCAVIFIGGAGSMAVFSSVNPDILLAGCATVGAVLAGNVGNNTLTFFAEKRMRNAVVETADPDLAIAKRLN
jgi:hypothetical protein